jgi:hypothetical protein
MINFDQYAMFALLEGSFSSALIIKYFIRDEERAKYGAGIMTTFFPGTDPFLCSLCHVVNFNRFFYSVFQQKDILYID